METNCERTLKKTSTTSSSFRLRSPSLNAVRLRRIFDLFDKNHDGMITIEELSGALNRLGLDTDVSGIESMVKSHILPGNLGLRFEDFMALHRSIDKLFFGLGEKFEKEERQKEGGGEKQDELDLNEAFNVFDEDGDGYISAAELQVVLRKLGFQEAQEMGTVEMMISSIDVNHDGRVDFFEFKDMMRGVMVRTA